MSPSASSVLHKPLCDTPKMGRFYHFLPLICWSEGGGSAQVHLLTWFEALPQQHTQHERPTQTRVAFEAVAPSQRAARQLPVHSSSACSALLQQLCVRLLLLSAVVGRQLAAPVSSYFPDCSALKTH
jgi:hypothetical protein